MSSFFSYSKQEKAATVNSLYELALYEYARSLEIIVAFIAKSNVCLCNETIKLQEVRKMYKIKTFMILF